MNEIVAQTRLAIEVRQQAATIAWEIAEYMGLGADCELPNQRVNQLVNSLSQGQMPNERLMALTRELGRLWDVTRETDEALLYRLLLQRLGLQHELHELQDVLRQEQNLLAAELAEQTDPKRLRERERDVRARRKALEEARQRYQHALREMRRVAGPPWAEYVLRRLEPLGVVRDDGLWAAQTRLAIALTALAVLAALQRSRTLQTEIAEREGVVRW